MSVFTFKYFQVDQSRSAMKVGTDALVLAASVPCDESSQMVLEIGSGTGVISLILAQRLKNATIQALEIDQASAEESQFNFGQSPWSNRLRGFHQDYFHFISEIKFDLIISNPPYYTTENTSLDGRLAQSKHIDKNEVRSFAEKTASLLTSEGKAVFIFPFESRELWFSAFQEVNLHPERLIEVHGKENEPAIRIIAYFSFRLKEVIHERLTIRKSNGNYSEEYKILTQDLHDRVLP